LLQHALAIFLGAFLLFQVQPLIGKFILPWFGGGPAVWTTCMLFFQVLLLAGYSYAHLLQTRLVRRRQAMVHIALLAAAAAVLPILPDADWKPVATADPTGSILLLLAASVGLPYLMLATTSPLIQAWFSVAHPGRSPYRLYALSNLGSLLALVSYPFLFEPAFALKTQSMLWSLAFGLFALVGAWCAWPMSRSAETEHSSAPSAMTRRDPGANVAAPGLGLHLSWVGLGAGGSLMLLAVTNQLCADVAIVPFLWVLPLTLYLLSFILCFHSARWYPRWAWWLLLFVVLGGIELLRQILRLPVELVFSAFGMTDAPDLDQASAFVGVAWHFVAGTGFLGNDIGASRPVAMALGGVPWLLGEGVSVPIVDQIVGLCLCLFVCCMVCHGELARQKPEPRHLTSFYLLSSLGGALGGAFVSLVAPRVFPAYLELHVGLWLVAALAMVSFQLGRKPGNGPTRRWRPMLHALVFASLLLGLGAMLKRDADRALHGSLALTRNFYGVLSVGEYEKSDPEAHHFSLQHGRIGHGNQFASPAKRRMPTSYYGTGSGVGLALRNLPRDPGRALRVGVVGLGTGTIAAYAERGDLYRFYEINPAVEHVAETWFHYLADARAVGADVQVLLGDARLSLERQEPQRFDVIALDAFSSDAIPIHLLTREAFEIYLRRHLAPDGVLAVHISNRYLDLEPVVLAQAEHFGYRAVVVASSAAPEKRVDFAMWVLITRNQQLLEADALREIVRKAETKTASDTAAGDSRDRRVLWTDDYSDLFRVLR
jgi:hypothetical protein